MAGRCFSETGTVRVSLAVRASVHMCVDRRARLCADVCPLIQLYASVRRLLGPVSCVSGRKRLFRAACVLHTRGGFWIGTVPDISVSSPVV